MRIDYDAQLRGIGTSRRQDAQHTKHVDQDPPLKFRGTLVRMQKTITYAYS